LLLTDTEESLKLKTPTRDCAVVEETASGDAIKRHSNHHHQLETNYRKTLEREKALREAFNKQRAETPHPKPGRY